MPEQSHLSSVNRDGRNSEPEVVRETKPKREGQQPHFTMRVAVLVSLIATAGAVASCGTVRDTRPESLGHPKPQFSPLPFGSFLFCKPPLPQGLLSKHFTAKSVCRLSAQRVQAGLSLKQGWSKHDEAVLHASLHGWEQHDAMLFDLSMAASKLLGEAWIRHDVAVFSQLKDFKVPGMTSSKFFDLMLSHGEAWYKEAGWAAHDDAVLEGLDILDKKWAQHDQAVFAQFNQQGGSQSLAIDDAALVDLSRVSQVAVQTLGEAWCKHDVAVFSALTGGSVAAPNVSAQVRRRLARTQSNLQELTTTLVRGYDQDTLFEGGATGYSV